MTSAAILDLIAVFIFALTGGLVASRAQLDITERLVRDFGHIADLLGPHLGCLLFQLRPSFHYTAARLDSIVAQLDPRRRNVVEFRHRSWWHEDVYGAFQEAGLIFCSCSGPRLPDELIKTADDVYLRFHGTTKWYRHDYTNDELDVWAARVRSAARPISGRTSTTTEKRAPSGTLTRFVSFWKSLDGQHEEASGRRQAPNRAPWDPKPTRRPPSSC